MLRAFNVFRTLLIVIACSAQEQYSSNFFQALLLFLVSEIFALTRARTTFFKLFQPRLLFFCYWDICSLPAQEQYHLNFVFNPSSPVQLCLMNKNCFYNPLVCTKNNHNGHLSWSTFFLPTIALFRRFQKSNIFLEGSGHPNFMNPFEYMVNHSQASNFQKELEL